MNVSRALPRMGWHLLLALVMLLMQQAGWRHGLEHHAHDDDGAPTHAACLSCVAHHAQGHALGSTAPNVLMLPGVGHVLCAIVAQPQCGNSVCLSYQSRAPPSVISA